MEDTAGFRSEHRGALAGIWRPLAVGGAALVLAAAVIGLTLTPAFRVRDIEVQGIDHLSRADVLRLSGITRSTNAVWLDEAAAEERIERHAWVSDASVVVSLPWNVQVRVRERVPVAIVDDRVGPMLVAGDGTLLGPAGRGGRLPVIHGPPAWLRMGSDRALEGAARALSALAPDVRTRVHRLEILPDGALEVVLRDGVRIAFGSPEAFGAKARAIDETLDWAEGAGERVRTIDVTGPGTPAVSLVR